MTFYAIQLLMKGTFVLTLFLFTTVAFRFPTLGIGSNVTYTSIELAQTQSVLKA